MTKQAKYNTIIKNLVAYYNEDKIKLIRFLKKEHYTQREIAGVLGVDESAVSHLLEREGK